jgi:NDP-sugar pyrophosphorylase family protein
MNAGCTKSLPAGTSCFAAFCAILAEHAGLRVGAQTGECAERAHNDAQRIERCAGERGDAGIGHVPRLALDAVIGAFAAAERGVFAGGRVLIEAGDGVHQALRIDAADESSLHDMGTNIIPMLTEQGMAEVYDFDQNVVPGSTDRDKGYWRDVGTLDAYHDAHMDLVSVHPVFNLYNREWPILSHLPPLPPAKFVEGGNSHESMVGAGSIVSGAHVRNSVLSYDVNIREGAYVEGSVLMPGVRIGRGAVVRRAILDKNVIVPDGAQIGVNPETDRERYTMSPGGIIVVGKGQKVDLG